MCGIAGIVSHQDFIPKEQFVRSILKSMNYRGPDNESLFSCSAVSMGYNRLRIVGSESLLQPFRSKSQRYVIFFNGEFYNLAELEKAAFGVSTKSEERIADLFEFYQHELFEKLDGMYAIAIWDEEAQILTLGRDSNGEKPLFYSFIDETFSFSSEINGLRKYQKRPFSINTRAFLKCMETLWVPEPDTVYNEIRCIPKGSFLKFNLRTLEIEIERYADKLAFLTPNSDLEFDCEYLKTEVKSAIHSRMISDVPIGAFLSAGIDSSIVTLVASEMCSSLATYSVSFEGSNTETPSTKLDFEAQEAKKFATELGVPNTEVSITPEYGQEIFWNLVKSIGQPYGVSSTIGVAAVAKRANIDGLRVLLSGDGADEAFAGYNWHNSLLTGILPAQWDEKLHYYASHSCLQTLFDNEFFQENYSKPNYHRWNHDLRSVLEHDRDIYFSNEMMNKLDRGCMLYSVEGRPPLAAPRLQHLARELPPTLLISEDFGKMLLRRAFQAELGEERTWRKKSGFDFPIKDWLSNGHWNHFLGHVFSNESNLVKSKYLKAISSRKDISKLVENFDPHLLLTIVSAEIWMENQ